MMTCGGCWIPEPGASVRYCELFAGHAGPHMTANTWTELRPHERYFASPAMGDIALWQTA